MPENEKFDDDTLDILHAKNIKSNYIDGTYMKDMIKRVRLLMSV